MGGKKGRFWQGSAVLPDPAGREHQEQREEWDQTAEGTTSSSAPPATEPIIEPAAVASTNTLLAARTVKDVSLL